MTGAEAITLIEAARGPGDVFGSDAACAYRRSAIRWRGNEMRLIYIVRRTEQDDPQPGAVNLDPGAMAGRVILAVAFGVLPVLFVVGWIIAIRR